MNAVIALPQSPRLLLCRYKAEIRLEESLIHRASINAITGVFNHQHFINLADKEMAYVRRSYLIYLI